jgi:hypothetical protein
MFVGSLFVTLMPRPRDTIDVEAAFRNRNAGVSKISSTDEQDNEITISEIEISEIESSISTPVALAV